MIINRPHRPKQIVAALLATGLIGASCAAHADEREDLERLRATVLSLVDTLVKNGVLPRDKVDTMMRDAETMATARLAQAPAPELGADGKKLVRVPYVPEAVKAQMREQIKAEVLAQTKAERSAGLDLASAGARIKVEGDLRLRNELTRLNAANTPVNSSGFDSTSTLIRAPDFLTLGGAGKNLYTFNTRENSDRTRVRARLVVGAELSDEVSASVGISTGASTGPTSTNQTLGQGAAQSPDFFNKAGVVLNLASLNLTPLPSLSISGGRIRNPFVGTDLVWAEDLNVEGVAVSFKPQLNQSASGFVTAGWFPLATSVPNQSHGRNLLAVQAGVNLPFGQKDNGLKLAAALYDYHGIEGVAETQASYLSAPDYVVRSEYGAAYRQKGNTLFRINAPTSIDSATNWGLASGFRELDLNATLDLAQFEPVHVILTGDIVKNLKFKRADINQRTGSTLLDGKSIGYLGKLQVGTPLLQRRGEWNAYVTYRYLGSDAVLDAFTSSDFGLGGTNNKGFILGASYAIGKNTSLSARWMTSDLIESVVPQTSKTPATARATKYSADLFQVDLNSRF